MGTSAWQQRRCQTDFWRGPTSALHHSESATGKLHNTLHVGVERLDHPEELGRAPSLRWDPETNMSLRITSCMRSVRWVNEARHFAAVFSAYPVAGAERIPCLLSSALRWNHTETSPRVDSVGHYCGLFRTTRAKNKTLPTLLSRETLLYMLQYLRTRLFLYRLAMLQVIIHWGTCLSVQHRQSRQYYYGAGSIHIYCFIQLLHSRRLRHAKQVFHGLNDSIRYGAFLTTTPNNALLIGPFAWHCPWWTQRLVPVSADES